MDFGVEPSKNAAPSPASAPSRKRAATLHALPDEVLERVLGNLDLMALAQVQGVDRRCQQVALSPALALRRHHVLQRASKLDEHRPPTLAAAQVSALFRAHLVEVGEQCAWADALAWMETLATEDDAAAERHAAFRRTPFLVGLDRALVESSPGYAAAVRGQAYDAVATQAALIVASEFGLPELAQDLCAVLGEPLQLSLGRVYATLASLQHLGVEGVLQAQRDQARTAAWTQRFLAQMTPARLGPLVEEFEGAEPVARAAELASRLPEAQRSTFIGLHASSALREAISAMFTPGPPQEFQQLFIDLGAYVDASVTEAQDIEALQVMETPEERSRLQLMADLVQKLNVGHLRRLGQDGEAAINDALWAEAPRLMLVHALELATRAAPEVPAPSAEEAFWRRCDLGRSLARELPAALAEVWSRWPAAPQGIVDYLHGAMGEQYTLLHEAATTGDEVELQPNYFAALVRAIAAAWPGVVPTPLPEA